jgi:hypothetical protein
MTGPTLGRVNEWRASKNGFARIQLPTAADSGDFMKYRLPPAFRRLVLGGAFLAATLIAFLPEPPGARAAEPGVIRQLMVAQNDAKTDARAAAESAREAAREASNVAREAAAAAKAAARDAKRKALEADADADTYDDGSRKGHHKGISIGLGGVDREYDSFDEFLDRDPALASMVLGIVFIVFLTPVLIVALVIWYKMRKTHAERDHALRLAEKGIVPPGERCRRSARASQLPRSALPPRPRRWRSRRARCASKPRGRTCARAS